MTRSKPTAWKNVKRDETHARRDLILRAATRRLNEVGYTRASMTAIAKELGLSTNALYHYFDSKADILLRCFERGLGLIEGCIDVAEAAPGNGNEKIRRFVAEARALIESEAFPGPWLVVHLPVTDLKTIATRDSNHRKRLAVTVRAGIEDGSIRDCDVGSTMGILLSGVYALPYASLVEELGEARLHSQLQRLVERALAP